MQTAWNRATQPKLQLSNSHLYQTHDKYLSFILLQDGICFLTLSSFVCFQHWIPAPFQWMPYCPADRISISIPLLISQAVECLSGVGARHCALHSLRLLRCNPTAYSSSSEAVRLPSGLRRRLLHAKSITATIIHRCAASPPFSIVHFRTSPPIFTIEQLARCLLFIYFAQPFWRVFWRRGRRK